MIISEKDVANHLACMDFYKCNLLECSLKYNDVMRVCKLKLIFLKFKIKSLAKRVPKVREGIEKQEEDNIDFELEFENDLRIEERRMLQKIESYIYQMKKYEERYDEAEKKIAAINIMVEDWTACRNMPRNSDEDENFLSESFQLGYHIECFLNEMRSELDELESESSDDSFDHFSDEDSSDDTSNQDSSEATSNDDSSEDTSDDLSNENSSDDFIRIVSDDASSENSESRSAYNRDFVENYLRRLNNSEP